MRPLPSPMVAPGARPGRVVLAAVGLGTALAGPAPAQVADATITASIAQRFELDTNLGLDDPNPGTSYFTDTRFALGILQETPTQVFNLAFDTGIRALWEAEQDFEFTFASPSTASAAYAQQWASGAVDGRLRYRQAETDFTRPIDDFLDPDTGEPISPDDPAQRDANTTERRYDANARLDLATDRPSSYSFGVAATRIDYDDVTTDRTPRDTVEGTATWDLALTPVFGTALTGRYYYYIADNTANTQINEAEVTASVVYTPSEVLRLSAGLGYVDRTQREFVFVPGPVPGTTQRVRQDTEDDAGLSVRGTVNYDFEEFVVTGNLRYADIRDGEVQGDLRVVYPLPNSQVNARLFQRYAGGDTGDLTRISGAAIGLLRDLDAVSRIGLDFAASRRENLDDPTDPDADRFEASATYSYDFTNLLTADIGYRFRNLNEKDTATVSGEDATSHAVFFQISRAFETRP